MIFQVSGFASRSLSEGWFLALPTEALAKAGSWFQVKINLELETWNLKLETWNLKLK